MQSPTQPARTVTSPEGWDTSVMVRYLEARAGLPPVPVDSSRYSKSRSPRNRRKIKERKIREAALFSKRDMELWTPLFGAPAPDTWINPLTNKMLPRPPQMMSDDWFRFVQAVQSESLCPSQIATLPDDHFARLGIETMDMIVQIRASLVLCGPDPNPLHRLAEEMRQCPLTLAPARPMMSPGPEDGTLLGVPDPDM